MNTAFPVRELWGKSVEIQIPEDIFPDEQYLKDKQELFDHPEHGWFDSTFENGSNGKKYSLHYRCNMPKNNNNNKRQPKAILIWQHGIVGQSGFGMKKPSNGVFTDFALRTRTYNENNIAVYAHDQLGHGFSEGERFYIPNGNWKINRDDYIQFVKFVAARHPGVPIFLSGDSYGGNLTLHVGHALQGDPDVNVKGILPNCPAIHGDLPPLPVIWALRYGLAPFFPRYTPFFMPHPITAERCWKDQEARAYFTDQTEMRGLSQGGVKFCLGTALGLLLALQSVQRDVVPKLTLPFHINHGTSDYGVPISGSEFLVQHAMTPKEDQYFNRIQGGYHALFSEEDAAKYLESELKFVEKQLSKK